MTSIDPVLDMPSPHSLILRMDITNTCNLDCIGCSLVDNRRALNENASVMKVAVFEKIADEVFPYLSEVALSCEAEPILHPQFVRIMKIIADKTERGRLPVVCMTTNATLLTPERLEAIFDAGVFRLTISIDGFMPETFSRLRKNGEISKVFDAIDEVVRRKAALGRQAMDLPRIQINYTLMKSNLQELIPLIDYSRRWALENFTVTHVYSSVGKDMSYESLRGSPGESDRVLAEAEKKCQEYGIIPRLPALFRRPPIAAAPKPHFWKRFLERFAAPKVSKAAPTTAEPTLACAAPWRMLKIRWDGSVHPCDLWNYIQPMGNVQTQSFEGIWRSEKYQELRAGLFAGVPSFAHCLKCDRISPDNLEKRKLQSALAHTSIGTKKAG